MSARERPTRVGKACACLIDARGRLLVFDHPAGGGCQLPKGTIEPGETPAQAVRRELHEESGLRFDGPLHSLGTLERDCGSGSDAELSHPARARAQLWHLFLMRWSGPPLPEAFTHAASGSPEEDGLLFAFRWLAPHDSLEGFALPYRQTIGRVRQALQS